MESLTQGVTFTQVLEIVAIVIAACAAISAITPTKVDDRIMSKVLRVVNVLGLNVYKAKNADDAG